MWSLSQISPTARIRIIGSEFLAQACGASASTVTGPGTAERSRACPATILGPLPARLTACHTKQVSAWVPTRASFSRKMDKLAEGSRLERAHIDDPGRVVRTLLNAEITIRTHIATAGAACRRAIGCYRHSVRNFSIGLLGQGERAYRIKCALDMAFDDAQRVNWHGKFAWQWHQSRYFLFHLRVGKH